MRYVISVVLVPNQEITVKSFSSTYKQALKLIHIHFAKTLGNSTCAMKVLEWSREVRRSYSDAQVYGGGYSNLDKIIQDELFFISVALKPTEILVVTVIRNFYL